MDGWCQDGVVLVVMWDTLVCQRGRDEWEVRMGISWDGEG